MQLKRESGGQTPATSLSQGYDRWAPSLPLTSPGVAAEAWLGGVPGPGSGA
jgi:hypothetical protein